MGTTTNGDRGEATTGDQSAQIAATGVLTFPADTPSIFTINPNPSITIHCGKTHVTIKPDGTIEYGEGCTPDAAAKAFWDALGYERKQREKK